MGLHAILTLVHQTASNWLTVRVAGLNSVVSINPKPYNTVNEKGQLAEPWKTRNQYFWSQACQLCLRAALDLLEGLNGRLANNRFSHGSLPAIIVRGHVLRLHIHWTLVCLHQTRMGC